MKINEKNLCVFATTPPFDLEGCLNKRGEVNKSWQKRYFVLKGNLLFYFEKKGDKEPLGLIIVEGCTIELAEEGEPYSFQIVFNGNRTYTLCASNQQLMELWMKALTCAGYEYKKLMIAELQRQLDELENLQKKNLHEPLQSTTPKPPPRRQNPFNRPAPSPPVINNLRELYSSNTNVVSRNTSNTLKGESEIYNNDDLTSDVFNIEQDVLNEASQTPALVINDKDVNFSVLHKTFGKLIYEDINNHRKAKANDKVLIEF